MSLFVRTHTPLALEQWGFDLFYNFTTTFTTNLSGHFFPIIVCLHINLLHSILFDSFIV